MTAAIASPKDSAPVTDTAARCAPSQRPTAHGPSARLPHGGAPQVADAAAVASAPAPNTSAPTAPIASHPYARAIAEHTRGAVHTTRRVRATTTSSNTTAAASAPARDGRASNTIAEAAAAPAASTGAHHPPPCTNTHAVPVAITATTTAPASAASPPTIAATTTNAASIGEIGVRAVDAQLEPGQEREHHQSGEHSRIRKGTNSTSAPTTSPAAVTIGNALTQGTGCSRASEPRRVPDE